MGAEGAELWVCIWFPPVLEELELVLALVLVLVLVFLNKVFLEVVPFWNCWR